MSEMKKTIIGTISGAIAGSVVASVITLSFVGGTSKTTNNNGVKEIQTVSTETVTNETPVSDSGFQYMAASSDKKVLSVEDIAKFTGPSIVGVSCVSTTQGYFGSQQSESSGSGIIIDSTGNIVTNYHVIEGASSIKVKLTSGNEYDATLIGGDEKTDIAVIKITANENLHVATLGNSDEVEVGELAVAIGNPLASELFGTVTAGVISGVNRTITVGEHDMTLIQTDAAISPGNSGGALINKYGEVIGINSVKLVDDAAEGLGFAIPMNEAVPIMKDLIDYGYVKGRPILGISVREITKELAYYNRLLVDYGLYVMNVSEGSGAAQAGIQRGDIIIKADGQKVTTSSELNKIRDTHKSGETMNLVIMRQGKEMSITVTLTEDLTGKK